jgi:hypothetical protein
VSLVFSDGPVRPFAATEADVTIARAAYDAIDDDLKEENGGIWRAPNSNHFPTLQDYMDYLPDFNAVDLVDIENEAKITEAEQFNEVINENAADGLGVFVRVFCQIAVLFFLEISIGLIMENYAGGFDPNAWAVAGQFQIDLLGLRNSVSVATYLNFDTRRHRHLEASEYERALASQGLEESDWDVSLGIRCVPGSVCEVFVEFFEVSCLARKIFFKSRNPGKHEMALISIAAVFSAGCWRSDLGRHASDWKILCRGCRSIRAKCHCCSW